MIAAMAGLGEQGNWRSTARNTSLLHEQYHEHFAQRDHPFYVRTGITKGRLTPRLIESHGSGWLKGPPLAQERLVSLTGGPFIPSVSMFCEMKEFSLAERWETVSARRESKAGARHLQGGTGRKGQPGGICYLTARPLHFHRRCALASTITEGNGCTCSPTQWVNLSTQ